MFILNLARVRIGRPDTPSGQYQQLTTSHDQHLYQSLLTPAPSLETWMDINRAYNMLEPFLHRTNFTQPNCCIRILLFVTFILLSLFYLFKNLFWPSVSWFIVVIFIIIIYFDDWIRMSFYIIYLMAMFENVLYDYFLR